MDRIVTTEQAREMLVRFIEQQPLPFTATITEGKQRTTAQNRLQRRWMTEIAEQQGCTPEEARGFCKLTIGVPILRQENEAFREKYDRVIMPLPYENKLLAMMVPLDMPITRIMTTKQKTVYLDTIYRHFSEKGIVLTDPEQQGRAA